MTDKMLRHAGTLIPAICLILFSYVMYAELSGELTWQRPATYGAGFVSLLMGAWALLQMAKMPRGEYPSLFLVALLYQKIFLAMTFGSVFGFAANAMLPWIPIFPDVLLYPILVVGVGATAMVNIILFFGRPRGWLVRPVDPVPLRPFFRGTPPATMSEQNDERRGH